ncbi:biliverdin-producing heme oxygenase [Gemmatimonas sp.]|uniref:biliverdin-producing heme oxygenase n=1 Tax=Gemmatimonas sp. TaxID=1962908 RepID=UPI003983065F
MLQDEFQSSPRSALAALKSATQHEHDALDAALDLLHPALGSAAYRHHLEAFFGFYAPMESALAAIGGWLENDIDLTARAKAALLRADLISLGVEAPDALPMCQTLAPLPNLAAAFGSLYVLEGASLGGQIISRHVEKQFGYTATHGAKFFNGYGARTGEMWMTFRRSVDAYGVEHGPHDQMIAGALATFVTFRQWCEQRALA